MLSLKTHSITDYCLGAAFLLLPYISGLSDVYFAHDVFTVIGFAIIGYSLLTDYRYSIARALPIGMHMGFLWCSRRGSTVTTTH